MQVREMIHKLGRIPRKRWGDFIKAVMFDVLMLSMALVLTVGLIGNFRFTVLDRHFLEYSAPILCLLGVALLFARGLYRVHARYTSLGDAINLLQVNALIGLIALGLFGWGSWVLKRPFSLAEPVLFVLLSGLFLAIPRVGRRVLDWLSAQSTLQTEKQRTLIVGGGDAGEMVMREILRNPQSPYRIVGFVDDNPAKQHMRIHGYPCLGTTQDIPYIAAEYGIQEIIIAIPSAEGDTIRRLFEICSKTSARIQIVPSIPAVFEKGVQLHQLRNVNIEDLLPREPVRFDLRVISEYVEGQRVLITGAGGSIGSELARQVAQFGPASLILLGKGENSIYQIQQELSVELNYEPLCIIADVRDASRIEPLMRAEQPTLVFHAAAHKHVPLMESNSIEAIKNNVLGTWVMAESAARHGVQKFVYVSTDKAVKPVSIMGATKRVGEMIVASLARQSNTEFAIVRFGNVLGSRGSLVPTLQMQIERGGPVRLTHPEMQRYFMSLSEAVHLILRVGAFRGNGDVFLLDMGKPVRIVDLAKDLIRLYGLIPGKDVEIVFTGVRPGEKLHEELNYDEEELIPTPHPKIRLVRTPYVPDWDWLLQQLTHLMELCEKNQPDRARAFLMELATGRIAPTPEVRWG